ncbi:hypothetical protein [Brucella sp. NBRC 13694]|jgi:hypothetical protein|uniref:DUF6932 family protein n=1 Tax=Brucella sp. NBRC 13694 TaxID=3075482 RepID=UPI00333E4CFF
MELYNLNIIDGFQWLDGSFMEDVENLRNRPPNDIDVVTFFKLPDGVNQQELFDSSIVFSDNEFSKNTFFVDGYFMPLADSLEDWHVQQISYWYSMWSHTREQNWKGFIRVDLAPEQDVAARKIVEHMQQAEAGL